MTDGWAGYNQLDALPQGYLHFSVNHKRNFVDPNNRNVHTQKVERMWRSLKESVPKGTRKDDVELYLNQFLYFRRFNIPTPFERFHLVLELIRDKYKFD